jgi:hypothetical protein
MSQATDYVLANQSGANFRSELNSVLAAVSSTNSGSTAPTTMYAYMMWVDTGVSPALLKLRNGANNAWITLGDVTLTNFGFAPLASPTLTGTPLSTTAAVDTNTTQIATTAYVVAQAGSATPLLNGTAAVGTSTRFARQDHVHGTDTTRAPLASPTFTGAVTIPAGTAAAPSITVTGDTNTGIYSPNADEVAISTGGAGRLVVDSSGRLLAGTFTARNNFFGTTLSSVAQIEGTGSAAGRGALSVINNDVSNNPPYLLLGRSGAASLGSNAVVVSGSRLGTLTFHGADGTSFIEAATVAGEVDGTPGSTDMPGRLVFSTTADGASSPTERMRISSAGRITVAGSALNTPVALTDAATVAVDLSLSNNYTLTLGGSRTLGAPTNQTAGQSGVIVITQDGTGSRILAYNAVWKFPGGTAPTLTTTASAVDVIAFYVESATRITARLVSDVK